MSDPMVKEESSMPSSIATPTSAGMPIQVKVDGGDTEDIAINSENSEAPEVSPLHSAEEMSAEQADVSSEESTSPTGEYDGLPDAGHREPLPAEPAPYAPTEQPELSEPPQPEESASSSHNFSSFGPSLHHGSKNDDHSNHQPGSTINPSDLGGDSWQQQIPPLDIPSGAGPKGRKKVVGWIISIILLLLVAGYLAIDAGLINSNINLPFHIFNKQKQDNIVTPPPAPTTPVTPPTPQAAQLPAGFSEYKISGTPLSFAYPSAWGKPTTTKVDGYSKLGENNKPDGVFAYRVKFATNKDVEVAATSSKYLSSNTKEQKEYFAYLQWCKGTNDNKFYQSVLNSTTNGDVATPTTVACDQGPLQNTASLDDNTILQTEKDKQTPDDLSGDMYIKNLDDKEWVVLRVLDTSTKNGDNIKKLLGTIKTSATAAKSSDTTGIAVP
jgi:hypothetical protein